MKQFFLIVHLLILPLAAHAIEYTWEADIPPTPEEKPSPGDIRRDELLARAKMFFDNDDLDNARRNLQKALSYDKTSPQLLTLLGRVHEKMEQPEKAFKAYKKALKSDPENIRAHHFLGMFYTHDNELAYAKYHLKALRRLCYDCEEHNTLAAAIRDKQYANVRNREELKEFAIKSKRGKYLSDTY